MSSSAPSSDGDAASRLESTRQAVLAAEKEVTRIRAALRTVCGSAAAGDIRAAVSAAAAAAGDSGSTLTLRLTEV
eukprot:CAMPEP_0113323006 /NCGR_PEP_ID=MMETSP0010_2-20120614/15993_1 /TAXON_ID=216773 ORGANISM="Corethron hystrix, Strain 308" /NCGR_SAMPLE_ID=MMETSP0010_2 /ASSEMBLY_ACC=CAM_ASM_000155 /LENGTH=74 /DNA_ID=CAMNT_0000181713 /DNA_START=45 /DNA_END=265 /DNA_ORIENTATION=+ /assembly_acc=CAM_ASM_000155